MAKQTTEVNKNDYWLEARKSPRSSALAFSDARNLPYECTFHKVDIAGVSVLRLSAWPKGQDGVPFSFALDIEAQEDGGKAGFDSCDDDSEQLSFFSSGEAGRLEWQEAQDSELGVVFPFDLKFQRTAESRFNFIFHLPEDTRCYGLGERLSGLNRRGAVHTLMNTDNPRHLPSMDSMYKSLPLLFLWHQGQWHAAFLDSPACQKWDLDSSMSGEALVTLLSRRGWQLYLFGQSPLKDLVAAYTVLTGRSKLPPHWALGHQQSRWSYPDEKTVRSVAQEFRSRSIPCDTIVLDIDYMDEYRVFTTSKERFPDLKKLIADLDKDGFKVITIVDPGVKKDPKYSVFTDGKKQDCFVKKADGKLFTGKVWPGVSAFPDFLRPEVRLWWGAQHGFYTDLGVKGIWTDMNEPAIFDANEPLEGITDELPPAEDQLFMQQAPEGEVGHMEVRNLYGMQMSRAAWQGLKALRPKERPFVLTRAGYAGMQRYTAVWLGDNNSWWEHLQMSIPMLVSVGLCGVPFAGVDIGGFAFDTTGELLTRWYSVGLFYPFFRNHCALSGRLQEPWHFGDRVEKAVRKFIEFHYRLLPYLQTLFFEHMINGSPIMRPLAFHAENDEHALDVDDQFFFGKDIIVAPIVHRAKRSRPVYLPEGNWYRLEGGPDAMALAGGRTYEIAFGFDEVPAFVREGSIIPLADLRMTADEVRNAPVTFVVFGDRAEGSYLEEDGISFDYEAGQFNLFQMQYRDGEMSCQPLALGYGAPPREFYVARKDVRANAQKNKFEISV